jgi:hypothetical protein
MKSATVDDDLSLDIISGNDVSDRSKSRCLDLHISYYNGRVYSSVRMHEQLD